MAALTDAGLVTGQLLERTHELRRHLKSADADFKTTAFLSLEIAELADAVATTFVEIDEILTRSPLNHPASKAGAEPAAQPSEAQQADAEGQPSPSGQRRSWLAGLLRPARWLGRLLRGVWQLPGSRGSSERPEFA
jgi:hypothetical protein